MDAIDTPSGWEVAGVIVAAVAALGTLTITGMNIRLLQRQNFLQKQQNMWRLDEIDRHARVVRAEFGNALVSQVFFEMSRRVEGQPSLLTPADLYEINRLGALTDEPSHSALRDHVEASLRDKHTRWDDPQSAQRLLSDLRATVDAWVINPETFSTRASQHDSVTSNRTT